MDSAALYTIRTQQQLASVMRSLRKQRGITQAELARRLGVSRQAITALEQRPETATFDRLMKVWAALGLEVSLRARGEEDARSSTLEW